MSARLKIVFVAIAGATLGWISVDALLRAGVPTTKREGVSPGVADCTFFPGHEHLYVSNPTKELNFIAAKLKEASSAVPQRRSFFAPVQKNFIDAHIFGAMARDGVAFADLTTDSEFVRRVYLDTTGRIPSPDVVLNFLNDPAADRREAMIDSLLDTPEYADRWSNFIGDQLQLVLNSTQINLDPEARNAYYNFVRASIGQNKPYDQFVTELITGTGNTTEEGPANFVARWRQPNGPIQDTYDNLAAAAGQFLGLSLNCISCHDGAGHTNALNLYLTKRTRYDFWAMAAFFSRTAMNPYRDPKDNNRILGFMIADNRTGGYILNTTSGNKTARNGTAPNEVVMPKYLPDGSPFDAYGPNPAETYRSALARMLTSDHQFARATVNYVWKELFGLGIVEPADNFDLDRISIEAKIPEGWLLQANQPELLEALAIDFEQHNYDLKYLIGTIMKSATYQLSCSYPGAWSDAHIPYFARKFPRRLKAEEIADVITQATNVPASYQPRGSAYSKPVNWAMQLPDTIEPLGNLQMRTFLDAFLRGNRDDRSRSSEGSILQALALLNNSFVTTRIKVSNVNSTVGKLWANKDLTPAERVTRLYLATLSRLPSLEELDKSILYLGDPVSASKLEDLQFAFINKVDFIFNY
ncbi:MAG: DUF1549 domain-containing protein [Acidobacteria bacterium]|nr:DUF1549 domain-containing protein [Acidobacteriota bacterium]